MIFTLDPTLCYELAGIADAASTDNTRPILGCVEILATFSDVSDYGTLRVVATDSFMLARREIRIDTAIREGAVVPGDDDAELGTVVVSAKAFKKAMKEAAQDKTTLKSTILVDISPDAITVAPEFGTGPEVRLVAQDYDYPKWEKLFGERIEDGELTLPAFNPSLLRRMEATISAKPADRATFPVRLAATKTATSGTVGTEMRPWSFTSFHTEAWYRSEIEVIIMPTRVADAA